MEVGVYYMKFPKKKPKRGTLHQNPGIYGMCGGWRNEQKKNESESKRGECVKIHLEGTNGRIPSERSL
jgi:hypothetical protein